MPPGASLLMRGLGMREIDRHIKSHKRGRKELDKYDRPKPFLPNRHGGDYPMPLGVHNNRSIEFAPYTTGEDITLLGSRYLDGHHGSLGGLPDDYVWRLFEWERSRQGYISPFKNVHGRKARERMEFEDWLRSRPDREELEAIRARGHDRGCVGA